MFFFLENEGIGVNLCCNYGPSKLLLYFIEYRQDQLNNKHMKTAVNLTKKNIKKPLSKEISDKSLNFFGPPTTK